MTGIHHYQTVLHLLPSCSAHYPLFLITSGNHQNVYHIHSFAFSRTLYSWNHTASSLFRLLESLGPTWSSSVQIQHLVHYTGFGNTAHLPQPGSNCPVAQGKHIFSISFRTESHLNIIQGNILTQNHYLLLIKALRQTEVVCEVVDYYPENKQIISALKNGYLRHYGLLLVSHLFCI